VYLSQVECKNLYNIFTKALDVDQNHAMQLIVSLVHHEVHNGIDYLVAELKGFKRLFLEIDHHGKASYKLSPKEKLNNWSYRNRRRRGTRNQILRVLFKLYAKTGITRILRICNIMGRWKAKDPTKSDYRKFRAQVGKSPSTVPIPKGLREQTDEKVFSDAISCARLSFKPLNDKNTHSLSGGKTSEGPVHITEELYAMAEAGYIYRAHEPYLASIFGLEPEARSLLWKKSLESERPVIGKIAGLTDDGGLKVRFVANLAKVWQVATSPLQATLKAYLRVQPEIASFDQDEGVRFMASELRDGKEICSVDIVNSTDNLERRIFEYVVEDLIDRLFPSIGHTREFALFLQAYYLDKDLSGIGIYRTPYENLFVRYNCGQAMGRWSSKGQLDFTMLVLSRHVGGNGSNSRINGDDYWTSDSSVGRRFVSQLDYFHIPWSEPKTFMYKRFGEFSGRIVDTTGILPVFKGRASKWKSDPFGFIRQYGKGGLELYPANIRRKIEKVAIALKDDKLSDFNSKFVNPYEGFEPPQNKSLIERQSWSELWCEQVFADHILREEIDSALSLYMDDAMLSADLSNPHSMYLWERYKKYAHEISILRQHSLFSRVAVQRFAEPNQRLDRFIDLLNSEVVKTSDGSRIQGYGSMGPIINRLRRVKAVTTSYKDIEDRRQRPELYKWVNKVYHSLVAWWRIFKPRGERRL